MIEWPFSEKTTTVLLGLAGGSVSGLTAHFFAPWFKWKLDQRKDEINQATAEKEAKRKQIRRWREMLSQAELVAGADDLTPEQALQRDPEYLTLEPYLSAEAKSEVYGRNLTIVVGSVFQGSLLALKEEITRIELEWGLR